MIDVYKNFGYNIKKAEYLLDRDLFEKSRDKVLDVTEGWIDDKRLRLRRSVPALNNMPLLTASVDGITDIRRSTVRPAVDRHLDIDSQTFQPKERAESHKTLRDRHLDVDSQTFQQQAVVITVTALESYLRDRYIIEKHKNESQKEIEKIILEWGKSFQNPDVITKRYDNELGIKDVLNITGQKEEIIKIMLIRHIIVHRAGEINVRFCDKFGISKRDWRGKNIQNYFEMNPNIVYRYIELINKFVEQVDKKSTFDDTD